MANGDDDGGDDGSGDDGGGDDGVGYYDVQVGDNGHMFMPYIVGKIKFIQHVRLYRVSIMERSVMAVMFMQVSHDMQVFLSVGTPPKDLRLAITNSKCFVFANSTIKTMLIRNNCNRIGQVYVGLQVSTMVFESLLRIIKTVIIFVSC